MPRKRKPMVCTAKCKLALLRRLRRQRMKFRRIAVLRRAVKKKLGKYKVYF